MLDDYAAQMLSVVVLTHIIRTFDFNELHLPGEWWMAVPVPLICWQPAGNMSFQTLQMHL